jgi:hypothetical protein
MFDFNEKIIDKIANPLKITKSSIIEFNIGELVNTGMYRFKKVIEMNFGDRIVVRYLIYSNVDDAEYIFEVFLLNSGQLETYLYTLDFTIPFSEDFLDVAGQRFLTTPQGDEYIRCVMPELDDRIDGVEGRIKVFDIEQNKVEKEYKVQIWDYQREVDSRTEYLNIEMDGDTGIFKIFTGEVIEDIFYKFFQSTKQ